MDGRALTVSEVERIADLESREVLLAKLAGAMKANLSKAAGLFNAPGLADRPACCRTAREEGRRGSRREACRRGRRRSRGSRRRGSRRRGGADRNTSGITRRNHRITP